MKKTELKQAYLEWNREITALEKRQAEIFERLKVICVEHGGSRWCSVSKLIKELAETNAYYYAMELASEYYAIDGQLEALRAFASLTDNFNID